MTGKLQFEKWATAFLAVVCALLVLNLVVRGRGRAGSPRSAALAAASGETHSRAAASGKPDQLARYDPRINLQQLQESGSRPLPELARNPFEYPPREVPKQAAAPGTTAAAAAPPPPPPPPPLKVLGYTERAGGPPEAVVTDEDQLYVVHDGESFAKRYHVLKISPSQVEISDETTRQNIRLPVPQ
ncbi:MAG: hypothetical protein LAN62_01215 [Acidobacteriia bacterium]|nr:hypothetical protein [Terriglobia bacterium]